MWVLNDSWRPAGGCLAALTLLTACGAGGTSAPSTSPASPMSAAVATTTSTTAQGARTQKWTDLDVGDCLADPPPTDSSVVMVSVVDCAIPHAAEVYLRTNVEVNAAIADVADRQCAAGLPEYTGQTGDAFVMTYLIDSNQDRTSGNPLPSAVICLLQAPGGGPMTGSASR